MANYIYIYIYIRYDTTVDIGCFMRYKGDKPTKTVAKHGDSEMYIYIYTQSLVGFMEYKRQNVDVME
jgi:hypothetical protein